ncbi:ankyrin repeat-containing domain protein [Mycena rebaudengoi]|nr:ankyrin repeat-containing domain protein [Mycena rebaudengoi]
MVLLSNRRLHLLFTSQPREIFSNKFASITRIIMDPTVIQKDIELFVLAEFRSKLETWRHWKRWNDRVPEISAKVAEKSSGMFRLATCLLVEMSRTQLEPNLDTILANLLSDLNKIYDRFLESIDNDYLTSVTMLLRWLVHSARPISLAELNDALAFDFSNPHLYMFDPAKRDHANILCGSLEGFVIVRGSTDSRSAVVSLAHKSVEDYLVSPKFSRKEVCNVEEQRSNTFIPQTCVGYLLHFADQPLNEHTFPSYPLAIYAANFWTYHLLRCHDRAALSTSTSRLLEFGSRPYIAFGHLYGMDFYSNSLSWIRSPPPPLYLCSKIGYSEGVRFLLEKGAYIDIPGGRLGQPPLHVASENGHTEIVRILLESKAKIKPVSLRYASPLHVAAKGGHTEVVGLLLKWGADVDAPGKVYENLYGMPHPFYTALRNGHIETAHLLLENGANLDYMKAASFIQACRIGDVEITRILLDRGVSVDTRCRVLHLASRNGHMEIVRLLLERGADPYSAGFYDDDGTPAQAAAEGGHPEIAYFLLEKGASIESISLVHACAKGYNGIVRILLERGADVSTVDKKHGTSLQIASTNGFMDIVHLLLEKNADVNAISGEFASALQGASVIGHLKIVRMLLGKGANVNVKGGRYGSALQAASYNGHIEIFNILLENRADINAAGGRYGSALEAASMRGRMEIVRLLLDKGAEVNGGDFGALQAASGGGHTNIVRLLLKSGADVNARRRGCYSALGIASANGHTEVARILRENGAVA